MGFPTSRTEEIHDKLHKLQMKILKHQEEMIEVSEELMEDATVAIFAYGIVARAARQAIRMLRKKRLHVGLIQPMTIWPFPDHYVEKMFNKVDIVIVAELNQGQLINEVQRCNHTKKKVFGLNRYDGEIITPEQIVEKVKEVR